MFGLFGKKHNFDRIANDFIGEFDARFPAGCKRNIAAIHVGLCQFGPFNAGAVETMLQKPGIIASLYVGLLAESCVPWANIISRKTERKFVEAVVPPLSGKLSPTVMQELYPEAGGTGRRIGLLTGTKGGGTGKDAAAEQHALWPTGQGRRDQCGDAYQVAC